MNEQGVETRFKDGNFWVRVDGGDEFNVHSSRWNNPRERAAIIALERIGKPKPKPKERQGSR